MVKILKPELIRMFYFLFSSRSLITNFSIFFIHPRQKKKMFEIFGGNTFSIGIIYTVEKFKLTKLE